MATDHEADGWAILHDRSALPPDARYSNLYLFGPLPSGSGRGHGVAHGV
jgi:hypothetical protein